MAVKDFKAVVAASYDHWTENLLQPFEFRLIEE